MCPDTPFGSDVSMFSPRKYHRYKYAERASANQLMSHYSEELRGLLSPHLEDFAKSLMNGVRARDRTCMNLYAKAMDLVRDSDQALFAFVAMLGCTDAGELRRLVERAKIVEHMDAESTFVAALEFVRKHLQRAGKELLIVGQDGKAEVVSDGMTMLTEGTENP